MSIDREAAEAMADMFARSAECPLRQVSGEMAARGREWNDAIAYYDDLNDGAGGPDSYPGDWDITLVGAVTPHMVVAMPLATNEIGGAKVERVLHRDGGVAIQYTDPFHHDPRPKYRNFHSAASPVVVRL